MTLAVVAQVSRSLEVWKPENSIPGTEMQSPWGVGTETGTGGFCEGEGHWDEVPATLSYGGSKGPGSVGC